MSETDRVVYMLAAKYGFDPTEASAYLAAVATVATVAAGKRVHVTVAAVPKSKPMPPGYFLFAEDNFLGSGLSQQKIAVLAANSQQLADRWEDLSEKERSEWNECALRLKPLKPP
jgi:hypothetical protein